MSPKEERGKEKEAREEEQVCPQCGSDDVAPIHQEPMWVASDQSDPELTEETWYRCLTCRYKWKEGAED